MVLQKKDLDVLKEKPGYILVETPGGGKIYIEYTKDFEDLPEKITLVEREALEYDGYPVYSVVTEKNWYGKSSTKKPPVTEAVFIFSEWWQFVPHIHRAPPDIVQSK